MFDLASDLVARRAAGLQRERVTLDGPQGIRVVIDGREYLSFCSNDYLGLAAHPALVSALRDAAAHWGVGAGASHLLGGHGRLHDELETAMAAFLGTERALLFSTGYMANLGVLVGLAGRGDRIYADRLDHASLLDAGLLSPARMERYRHGDIDDLRRRLSVAIARRRIVATDGVFSMDGDLAPLPDLLRVCDEHAALCYVDDAHGIGVVGPTGRGTAEHLGIDPGQTPQLLQMVTLGKALGGFGALVAGSGVLIESLLQRARTYIYTTALPPALAAVSLTALAVIREEPWRREHLARLVTRFREGCDRLGLRLMPSATPIQPVVIGDNDRALRVAAALRRAGLLVFAIRRPTVPAGTERLRITLSAAHSHDDIDRLCTALVEALDGAS